MNTTDTILFICKRKFLWNIEAIKLVRHFFSKVVVVTYDGEKENLPHLREQIGTLNYDFLISFWSEYFILPNEISNSKKGAINFHPAPVTHPGLGMFSYIYAFPEKRNYHGITVHEVDEKFDHGVIYYTTRWDIKTMTPDEVCKKTVDETLSALENVLQTLSIDGNTTRSIMKSHGAQWSPIDDKRLYTRKGELEYLAKLPSDHIAHEADSYRVTESVIKKYFEYLRKEIDVFEQMNI